MSIDLFIVLAFIWAGFVSYELWGASGAILIASVWFAGCVIGFIRGSS